MKTSVRFVASVFNLVESALRHGHDGSNAGHDDAGIWLRHDGHERHGGHGGYGSTRLVCKHAGKTGGDY